MRVRDRDDIGFDFDQAKKCAGNYSNSTGVQSVIINVNGETLYSSCSDNKLCNLCRSLCCTEEARKSCS